MAKAPPRRAAKAPRSKTIDGTAKRTPAAQKRVANAEHVKPVRLSRPAGPARQPEARKAPSGASTSRSSSASVSRSSESAPRLSTGSLIGAGVAGGLVAFLLLAAFQWAVIMPGQSNGAAERDEAIAALGDEIETLRDERAESGDAEGEDAASSEELAALTDQVSALEERLATLEDGASEAEGAGSEAMSDLETRLVALEEAQAASEEERAARDETISGLESAVAGLESDLSQANDAVTARLDEIDTALADDTAEQRVARAFAAAELKSAIDRGGAFSGELQAYDAAAPDDEAIAALADYAEAGVPTRDALVRAFPDVAREMLSTTHAGDDETGMFERLRSSAMSVVTVRPTGEAEGDAPESIIARMEGALVDGDLDGALSEWETLPDAAKAVSQGFADDLRARATADSVLEETLSTAAEAVAAETN